MGAKGIDELAGRMWEADAGPEQLARVSEILRKAGCERMRLYGALFRHILRDLHPFCLGLVQRQLLVAADLDDLEQDTLYAVFRRLPAALPQCGTWLKPWVFRIARHRAIDRWRARRRSPGSSGAGGGGEPVGDRDALDAVTYDGRYWAEEERMVARAEGRRVLGIIEALDEDLRRLVLPETVRALTVAERQRRSRKIRELRRVLAR